MPATTCCGASTPPRGASLLVCGLGRDRVFADRSDVRRGCESTVLAPRPPKPPTPPVTRHAPVAVDDLLTAVEDTQPGGAHDRCRQPGRQRHRRGRWHPPGGGGLRRDRWSGRHRRGQHGPVHPGGEPLRRGFGRIRLRRGGSHRPARHRPRHPRHHLRP
ncbi:hypothetical protein G5V59_26555 [Nocardioides sp. W3-2-3]|nr:hypothetical protein [Nocardioides convexus]